MLITIHSKGRATLTTGTLAALAPCVPCTVVCPADEVRAYAGVWASDTVKVVGCPCNLADLGLPWVQQWIVDHTNAQRLAMLDDDLLFFTRDYGTKRRHRSTATELQRMFMLLYSALRTHSHAGIMVNKDMGLQDVAPDWSQCGPMRSVLAYNVGVMRQLGIRFDRVVSKADYDVTLQLLRLGHRAAICRLYGHEQCGGPDLPGGATPYRDEAMHKRASTQLAALHPQFVTVVTKVREGWPFPRTDVRVQWQKALASYQPNDLGV